eukprot:UN29356
MDSIRKIPGLTDLVSGYLGGACGIFCTHPLDTVRVRVQYLSQTESKINYVQIVKDLIKKKGFLGLYNGVIPPVFFGVLVLPVIDMHMGFLKREQITSGL